MGNIKVNEINELLLNGTVDYQIYVNNADVVATANSTNIKVLEDAVDEEIDFGSFKVEFEENVSKTDKTDYILAASSGVLTGALSILWSEEFSLSECKDWGNKEMDELVMKFAKTKGFKPYRNYSENENLKEAIKHLEGKYPFLGDKFTADFGGGLYHHLRDFSHHPSIVGLVCSILMQFTPNHHGYGLNRNGEFIKPDLKLHPADSLDCIVGKNFPEKITFGTLSWLGHLLSDAAGSSTGKGFGMGLPSPLMSIVLEISSIPHINELLKDDEGINTVSQYISRLYNGLEFVDEEGNRIQYDLRTEMGIAHHIAKKAEPVIINECIVRTFYLMSRLAKEIRSKDIRSIKDLKDIEPRNFIPFKNRALTRMITVSSSTFVAINLSGNAVRSAIKNGGINVATVKSFFLSINYVGVGRMVIACASDSKYIREDVRLVYEEYLREKEFNKKSQSVDSLGIKFLTLSEKQTQILDSLKLLSLEYDVLNTKKDTDKINKKEWIGLWKEDIKDTINVSDDYFLSPETTKELLGKEVEEHGSGWLEVVAIELSVFQPYYILEDGDLKFKNLKFDSRMVLEGFVNGQSCMNEEDYKALIKLYKQNISKLEQKLQKTMKATVATLAIGLATGGLGYFAAPSLAVLIAGDAVAGLSGAALTSASLAFVGGGSLVTGGMGMAGGIAILSGGGALVGVAASGTASLSALLAQTSEAFVLNECAKLMTMCKRISIDKYNDVDSIKPIVETLNYSKLDMDEEAIRLRNLDKKENAKTIKRIRKSIKYLTICKNELEKMIEMKES